MKKIIKLTESDLRRIVRRVIREQDENEYSDELINKPGYNASKMITGLPIKVRNLTKNDTQEVNLKFEQDNTINDIDIPEEWRRDDYVFWGTGNGNESIKGVSLYDELILEFTLPFKLLELKEDNTFGETQISKIELIPSGDKTNVKINLNKKTKGRRIRLDGYVDEMSQRKYISPEDKKNDFEKEIPSQENKKDYLTAIFNSDKVRIHIAPFFDTIEDSLNAKIEESVRNVLRRKNNRRY
jgi:hypothetical protein